MIDRSDAEEAYKNAASFIIKSAEVAEQICIELK
jgi:hypothetical protein